MSPLETKQRALCLKYGADFLPTSRFLKVGIADDVRSGLLPINGLRNIPVGDTSGWYIWAGGEPSDDDEYFNPLHLDHLEEWYPGLILFMGLAPGWRFQTAPNYEDVWFDPSILVK